MLWLMMIVEDADAASLHDDVILPSKMREVWHVSCLQIEEAQRRLLPTYAIARVRIQEQLPLTSRDTGAIPQLKRRVLVMPSCVHDVWIAVIDPRLPRLILSKQRILIVLLWTANGDTERTAQRVYGRKRSVSYGLLV